MYKHERKHLRKRSQSLLSPGNQVLIIYQAPPQGEAYSSESHIVRKIKKRFKHGILPRVLRGNRDTREGFCDLHRTRRPGDSVVFQTCQHVFDFLLTTTPPLPTSSVCSSHHPSPSDDVPLGHAVEFRRCRFQRYADNSPLIRRICDRDSPP